MWSKRNTQNVILPIRLNPFVFWSSAISISLFGLLFVLFPSASQNGLTWIQQQVNQLFG